MKNFIKINRALAAKKRFLSFLAMSAVVLGMASCGGDSNAPALKNFKVQVKDLTETSLTLEIEALIPDKYFCFDFVTEEAFKKNGADFYFKKAIEQIEVYHMLPEELFSKNKVSVPYQIEQGKEYVLCIFYVNDKLELDGAIEHIIINTKVPRIDDVIQSTANFDVSVTNITATTASLKIEPKEGVQFYSYDIISKYAYTKHKEVALAEFGEEVLKGPETLDINKLMPDTEYIIYMRKEDEKGEPLGEIETVAFRTANVETVELPKKELTGYVAYGTQSSIGIYAEDANKDIYLIAVFSTQLTGSFSTEDIVSGTIGIAALVIKGEEKYPIFRINFTGRKDGETTYVYEGWFDCADGFRYNFRFTCAYSALVD